MTTSQPAQSWPSNAARDAVMLTLERDPSADPETLLAAYLLARADELEAQRQAFVAQYVAKFAALSGIVEPPRINHKPAYRRPRA